MPSKLNIDLPKGTKVPDHVAIVPDGNRRWARARKIHTLEGHKAGFDNAVTLGRTCRDWGIHTITLWGFSTENWDREKKEVSYLMKLYEKLIDDYLKEAMRDEVRIFHLGRKDRLPKNLLNKLKHAEDKTKNFTRYVINIAIDYGGRDEILRAVKGMVRDRVKEEDIDSDLLSSYLDTNGQPYPNVDLMIRTSGEQRTSGFLLWQSEYNEYYFADCHFPDFGPEKLKEAVLDYSRRRRRFGGNDAVQHLSFKPELSAKLELGWWRLKKVPEGTRLRDFVFEYIKEQYGLSKELAKEAGKYMLEALSEGDKKDWEKAKKPLKKFYKLIKKQLKLAFEPEILTSLRVKLWQEIEGNGGTISPILEELSTSLMAEEYRISNLQAAKAAHLRLLAEVERHLAEAGQGEYHWERAEDYLHKYYKALKERVA